MIKRKKIDLSEERRILQYMITSTSFLTQLQGVARPQLFSSSYSQTVSNWIWDFYSHTSEAPGRGIEDIYLRKRKDIHEEEDHELISEFLTNLSKDWAKAQISNIPYTVKSAIEFFKIRSLERMKDRLADAINANDHALGERLISEYRKVDRPSGEGVDILQDHQAIINAFSIEQEYLFTYPGPLGSAIGPFRRGDFLGILGAMKKGKSHYLWFTAYRAALMGLKVIFISAEMTESQMLRRMWHTVCGQPLKDKEVEIAEFVMAKNGKYDVGSRREVRKGIDLSEVKKKQRFYQKQIRSGEIRLITFSNYSASVKDIETELVNLEYYEGFIPDVVVVDYADILKPLDGRLEYRHQMDSTWKALRGMAQERSILVVTGTQSGRAGLVRDVGGADVAEDIRKIAHVTHMIAINQKPHEKKQGILRMEVSAQREGTQFVGQIIVLQNLEIGRMYLNSKYKEDVNLPEDHEKKNEKDKDD